MSRHVLAFVCSSWTRLIRRCPHVKMLVTLPDMSWIWHQERQPCCLNPSRYEGLVLET